MESVLIKIPAGLEESTEWVVLDEVGQPHAAIRKGPLSSAAPHIQQRQVIALAPSENLLIDQVEFPSRNRSKLRQALPFLLEERLADDVEGIHFAMGSFNGRSTTQTTDNEPLKVPIAAIEQKQLQKWLDQFKAHNIPLKAIIPDLFAVPYEPGSWSVLINDAITLVRTDEAKGFACDTANLEIILQAAFAEAGDTTLPASIKIWQPENEPLFVPILGDNVVIEHHAIESETLNMLARGLKCCGKLPEHTINLLQGQYSPKKEYSKLLGPWMPAILLLAVWLLLTLITKSITLRALNEQSETLDRHMAEIYKKTFPGEKSASNVRLMMERKLKQLDTGEDANGPGFLILFDVLSKELKAYSPTIKTLSYTKQQLDLELELATLQDLDALKAKIERIKPYKVEIQSATTQGEKVLGRLRLSAQ